MNLLEGASIPLHCNVCPKKPDFSDTSHLLTHIQSKGHLSNHYKVTVRANHDAAAKQIIDDYNAWYQQHNLNDLMHERLSQKDKKSRNAAPRRSSATKPTSSRITPTASSNAPARRQSRLRTQQHLLDPQLNRHLTANPMPHIMAQGQPFSFGAIGNYHNFNPPPLQNWAYNNAHDSPMSNSIKQESIDSDADDYDDEEDDDYEYDMAPRRQPTRRAAYSHINSGSAGSVIKEDFSAEDPDNCNAIAPKGIQWPGMSQFDSATAEAKRKRNQKKHPSVIVALRRASEQIAPIEQVFDKDGTLRKERDVNYAVSDDDLISGESAPESEEASKKRAPKKKAATRAALRKKDANNGRATRGRGKAQLSNIFAAGPYYDGFGDDDNDDMTYRPRGPKIKQEKRAGVSIHRDNTGPEITFDQPAGLNYLNSGFGRPQPPSIQQSPMGFGSSSVDPRTHGREKSWSEFQMNPAFRPNPSGYGVYGASNIDNTPLGSIGSYAQLYTTARVGMAPPTNTGFQNQSYQNSLMANPLFPASIGGGSSAWDMFGDELSGGNFSYNIGLGGVDSKDGTMANPLFLKDDDEVTLSAARGSEK